jgi:type I restriction enzyme, R subunit
MAKRAQPTANWIQQIVSRAVVSTEIVDIMKAAGLESPDISRPVSRRSARHRKEEPRYRGSEKAHQWRRSLTIQAQRHANKAFSERLEAAISRYHKNALTTAQVIEELIQLAKDIRAARARGLLTKKSRSTTPSPTTKARGKSWANPHCESSRKSR